MRRLILAMAIMTLAAFVVRAQQQDKPAAAPQTKTAGARKADKKTKAAAEDYKPAASEYGKTAKCPVTGEGFKVSADTKAVKYKGKVYYFCCPGCAPAFKKNPAKFAK